MTCSDDFSSGTASKVGGKCLHEHGANAAAPVGVCYPNEDDSGAQGGVLYSVLGPVGQIPTTVLVGVVSCHIADDALVHFQQIRAIAVRSCLGLAHVGPRREVVVVLPLRHTCHLIGQLPPRNGRLRGDHYQITPPAKGHDHGGHDPSRLTASRSPVAMNFRAAQDRNSKPSMQSPVWSQCGGRLPGRPGIATTSRRSTRGWGRRGRLSFGAAEDRNDETHLYNTLELRRGSYRLGGRGSQLAYLVHCSADRDVAIASGAAKDRNLAATTEAWQRWALRLPSGMTEGRNASTCAYHCRVSVWRLPTGQRDRAAPQVLSSERQSS
jgi:hypothetical protein